MQGKRLWLSDGKLVEIPAHVLTANGVASLLRDERMVCITINNTGTAIHWDLAHASWVSLYTVIGHLRACPAPFHLSFFTGGWIKETHAARKAAASRIDELVGKSDIRLSRKAYINEKKLDAKCMPPLLQLAISAHADLAEHRIDTIFEEEDNSFYLTRAGDVAQIRNLMGKAWVKKVCNGQKADGKDFDPEVMSHYSAVLETGKPRFDHVYAIVTPPGHDPTWVPYHRLTVPTSFPNGRIGVSSFCQHGNVDCRPI